jgi:hypothetical protein
MTTIAPSGSCTSFDVIEVALVIDSSLCARAGGSSEVDALSQSIIAGASQFYEVPGLPRNADLLYGDSCDPNTDPIKPFLNLAGTNAVRSNQRLLQLYASATSKSKLMPFIYFTAKTSQEPARLGALLLELCDTRGYNRRQRDKLPGILYPEQACRS